MLMTSVIGIGGFLVNRLRFFFKSNYREHSNSIVTSIILMSLAAIFLMAFNWIKITKQD